MEMLVVVQRFFAANVLIVASVQLQAQDFDGDQLPDSVEQAILQEFSPVWWPGEMGQAAPQPIDWMCRHGRWKIFRNSDGSQVDAIPAAEAPYTVAQMQAFYLQARSQYPTSQYSIAWSYYNARDRFNQAPGDVFTWQMAAAQNRGIYGRVWQPDPSVPDRYGVQFFAHFGWNETDAPWFYDIGNHEGDWVCVDLTVRGSSASGYRIESAVFHNHGRQVFVEDPRALVRTGNRVHVFLERGTNELLPWAGQSGFQPGDTAMPQRVPRWVSTNHRLFGNWGFGQTCTLEYESDCNLGYTAVREHEADGPGGFVIIAKNIGEHNPNNPAQWAGSDPEARFIHVVAARYGSVGECPQGPPYQSKMWRRDYSQYGSAGDDWNPGPGMQTVWVEAGALTFREFGSEANPFLDLRRAVPFTRDGGVIYIKAGNYAAAGYEVDQDVTFQAVDGPVTIGSP
jgi:hypothetical protein